MLLSATEAIYSGNLPVKKLYSNNNLAYKPKEFPFCSVLKPLVIQISGAGIASVNGIWYLAFNGVSYFKPGTVSTYGNLNIVTQNISGWNISIGQYGDTTLYYRVSGLSPIPTVPPLTGWRSLNDAYNPPPVLTYNQPLSAVYETFLKPNQVNILIEPTLEPDRDYFLNIENNTFFGNSSSTQFANITSISNVNTTYYDDFDTDYFSNLKIFSGGNIKRGIIFNNSKLQQIGVFNASSLRLYNNLDLQDINLGDYTLTPNDIINSPQVSALTLGINSQVTNIDLQIFPNLRNLSITSYSNLTSLQTLSSYPNFERLSIGTNNLSGYEFLDTFLLGMSGKPKPSYTHSSLSKLLGRSNISNNAFLEVFKKNQNINLEIDPLYPIQTLPDGYYPSTLGNELVVSCPISANNTNFTQHRTLSGIYTKVDNAIFNDRDVFRNINDFYVLYDKDNTRWTVIGPTSGSQTVWLSALETYGDYGNVPSIGWSGRSFRSGGQSIGTNNSGWWNDTAVYSTQMLLFSSNIYSGTAGSSNGRVRSGVFPLSGWNSNFYWRDYDFSGIGYQNVNDPTWNGRWTLISPVHYINAFHFPSNLSIGSKINFIHKDRTISTRTVLSAVNLPGANGNDLRIGIFDAPLSAAAYPIGSLTNFITAISSSLDFTNFLYGPVGTGKVGIGIPSTFFNDCRYNIYPTTYPQITSIPKSLWFAEGVYTGDSSAQFWYTDTYRKQLVVLALTKFVGPIGPALLDRTYTTLYNLATALCQQFYGTPLMYQLTAYNF